MHGDDEEISHHFYEKHLSCSKCTPSQSASQSSETYYSHCLFGRWFYALRSRLHPELDTSLHGDLILKRNIPPVMPEIQDALWTSP
jgi:hypothetical protein